MPAQLPSPVNAYFAANPAFNVNAMLAPFAPDAIVVDERETHTGLPEIRTWIVWATVGARAVATPVTVGEADGAWTVDARVAGDFPGSPVTLTFRFELDGDRIARLEIA